MRMMGLTPSPEMATTELCMASSPMCPLRQMLVHLRDSRPYSPCSQSMMMASRPVLATICPMRVEGMPMNVINGFSSFRSLLSRRSRGFWMVVVWAVGNEEEPLEMVMLGMLALVGWL